MSLGGKSLGGSSMRSAQTRVDEAAASFASLADAPRVAASGGWPFQCVWSDWNAGGAASRPTTAPLLQVDTRSPTAAGLAVVRPSTLARQVAKLTPQWVATLRAPGANEHWSRLRLIPSRRGEHVAGESAAARAAHRQYVRSDAVMESASSRGSVEFSEAFRTWMERKSDAAAAGVRAAAAE